MAAIPPSGAKRKHARVLIRTTRAMPPGFVAPFPGASLTAGFRTAASIDPATRSHLVRQGFHRMVGPCASGLQKGLTFQ